MAKFLDKAGLERFWENSKVKLSAKQDKLTGTPGQVVGFDADGGAAAVRGWSNKNLLDNSYWAEKSEIINQRGQEEYTYTNSVGYTIDRWAGSRGTVTLDADGIVYTTGAADTQSQLAQRIEKTAIRLGSIYTFSAIINDELYSFSGKFYSNNNVRRSPIITIDGNPWYLTLGTTSDIYYVSFRNESQQAGHTIKIRAAKLELGSIQTLAYQDADGSWVPNDPPPDKALELAKCQRYYQIFATESLRPSKAEDFRPVMRINPTLSTISINGVTYYTADANL